MLQSVVEIAALSSELLFLGAFAGYSHFEMETARISAETDLPQESPESTCHHPVCSKILPAAALPQSFMILASTFQRADTECGTNYSRLTLGKDSGL